QPFWVAHASGNHATLSWTVTDGSYRVVAMNTDGAAAVTFHTQLGLTIPHMFAIGAGLLTGGIVLLLVGGLLLVLGIRAQPRSPGAGPPHGVPDQARSTPHPSPHAGPVPQPGAPAHDTPAPAPTADP